MRGQRAADPRRDIKTPLEGGGLVSETGTGLGAEADQSFDFGFF